MVALVFVWTINYYTCSRNWEVVWSNLWLKSVSESVFLDLASYHL